MTLYSTCFRSSCGSRVATGSVRATVREFSAWPLVVGRVWPEPPVVSWPAVSPASAPALCAGAADSFVPGACAEEQAVSVQSATASARISAKMDLLVFIRFLILPCMGIGFARLRRLRARPGIFQINRTGGT